MAGAWFSRWNKSYKAGETNRQVCVHGFVDNKEVWKYLPWNHRGWHAGGTANNDYIGIEMCEPEGHTYRGATMIGYDTKKNEAYFQAAYKNAVELFAHLCKEFKLDPLGRNVIIDHQEGQKLGIASNHADVMHWFPKHGKSMDTFRADVKKAMNPPVETKTQGLHYVQVGAFSKKENADIMFARLIGAGYEPIIKYDGRLYRVQTGAFTNKSNAINQAGKLNDSGFEVHVSTNGGGSIVSPGKTQAPASRPTLRVGSHVKVKSGATDYNGRGLAGFVYRTTYDVMQINGDRVVIGKGGTVTAAVNVKDLEILK
jgi:hypothetical protein